jgi:hypothetical protein
VTTARCSCGCGNHDCCVRCDGLLRLRWAPSEVASKRGEEEDGEGKAGRGGSSCVLRVTAPVGMRVYAESCTVLRGGGRGAKGEGVWCGERGDAVPFAVQAQHFRQHVFLWTTPSFLPLLPLLAFFFCCSFTSPRRNEAHTIDARWMRNVKGRKCLCGVCS